MNHLYSEQLIRSVWVAAAGLDQAVIADSHAVQSISHLETLYAKITSCCLHQLACLEGLETAVFPIDGATAFLSLSPNVCKSMLMHLPTKLHILGLNRPYLRL